MKKILIIFCLIYCISSKKVIAETIFGEYKSVDNLSKEKSDEIKIETYKLYNTYSVYYEDMGYMKENPEYVIDKKDYIYEEIITKDYENSDEYITINIDYLNKKKTLIILSDFFNLKIYELEITNKGEKINYTVPNILNENIKNIYDNHLNTF